MVNLTSMVFDTNSDYRVSDIHNTGNNDIAQTAIASNFSSEPILLLYRYLWLPARYAHHDWFMSLGFTPKPEWQYGKTPRFDQCLNQALQAHRGVPSLPLYLNDQQSRTVRLAPKITAFALAIGLFKLGCSDYLLLPEYRQVLLRWLDDEVIWQLFGLIGGKCTPLFSPADFIANAIAIGTAVLNRAAQNDPVLYAVLIMLPPCKRALWLQVPTRVMNILERTLCNSA